MITQHCISHCLVRIKVNCCSLVLLKIRNYYTNFDDLLPEVFMEVQGKCERWENMKKML